ncbi:glycosyltransferase [Pleurocapsales cyanobacterium LEGE 10410]|nr:glycosyltransferase [Pleurocapsales cyanobacterium LEGE 10410]
MVTALQQQIKSLLTLAVTKHKEGQIEEAIILYQQSIELDENQPAWIYGNVITLLAQSGRIDSGFSLGERALNIYPDSDEIYRAIGLTLTKQGDIENSINYYLTAIEIDRNQPDWLYSCLIEKFVEKNQLKRAVELGIKGIAIYPNSAWINYHLGDCFSSLEQWSKALDAYKTADKQQNNLPMVRSKINFVTEKKALNDREDNVLECLEEIGQNPKNVEVYYKLLYEDYYNVLILLKLAFSLAERNNFNNAIQYYQKAIALNCNLVNIYINNQEVFGDGFEIQKTISRFELEVKLPPNKNTTQQRNLSNTLFQKQHRLLGIYSQILEAYPNEIEAYLELANIYAEQNRLVKAIALCKRALNISPNNADVQIAIKRIQNIQSKFYKNVEEFSTVSSDYHSWLKRNSIDSSDIDWIPETIDTLGYEPLISIVVLNFNTSESYLIKTLESVILQIYPYWELCIADRASCQQVQTILEKYAARDSRIKPISIKDWDNTAAALNSILELATGDFITFLNHKDLLTSDALYEVAELLNQHPEADLIYSDEDKVNADEQYFEPYLKPDWCPDSFLSRMYISHLGVYRRSIIDELGGFRSDHEGALDYDLVLRFTEQTHKIFHISKILYHQRVDSASMTTYGVPTNTAAVKAIAEALERRNEDGRVIEHDKVKGVYAIRYKITDYKLVSILIPTKNQGSILNQCLKSIFDHSTYPNYEVIVVDNGSTEPDFLELMAQWQENEPERFSCHSLDIPFNYSQLNNFGISKAKGDYLLFLNNDTEVITKDWIEAMVEQAQRDSIGAVGAMLLYQDRTIQHGGVILGIRGVAGHSHKHYAYGDSGYAGQLLSINNYSAVTAACLMCRKEVYQEVNGFDEGLPVAFNDVDLCLKMKQNGYNNVWLPHVVLYHYESKSRGNDDTPEKQHRFQQEVAIMTERWGSLIGKDPCYNINLSKVREDYSWS